VLAIFPHDPAVDVQALAAALNSVDWADLGFVCDGRFLFTQRSLEQTPLPASFEAFAPGRRCKIAAGGCVLLPPRQACHRAFPGPARRRRGGEKPMVPRLTTALNGPLLEIERRFLDAMPEIERWLRGQWQEHTPPFTARSICAMRVSSWRRWT
jgi:hypothetical protein